MKDLFILARQVQDFLDAQGWRSCVIGGIAVQRWSEPRLTRDVDVTLLTGFGGEEAFVDAILQRFRFRAPGGRKFALENRVMLLAAEDGTGIDLALGGLPFEENVISRASNFEFYPGLVLRTCSAEDLVVMKAFAGRELDWGDVQGRNCPAWGGPELGYHPVGITTAVRVEGSARDSRSSRTSA